MDRAQPDGARRRRKAPRALALLLLLTTHARAESDDDAEELFRQGRRLLEAGDTEEACKKFAASERLKPHDVTELNLGDCFEKLGKTASAWEVFVKLAGSAKREDRAAEGRKRAKALEAKLVHLTIEVETPVDDLVITRNDIVVDREKWSQAVPVDPDEYTITAKAPGREDWSTSIKVKSKDKTVAVPKLKRVKKPSEPAKPEPSGPNRYGNLPLGLAIGGGAGIAIATGFALHSRSLQNESDTLCPFARCGNQRGVDLNQRARTEGWIANIGWGLGSAALVAALVTWRLGKRSESASIAPVVANDQAGVLIGGSW